MNVDYCTFSLIRKYFYFFYDTILKPTVCHLWVMNPLNPLAPDVPKWSHIQ